MVHVVLRGYGDATVTLPAEEAQRSSFLAKIIQSAAPGDDLLDCQIDIEGTVVTDQALAKVQDYLHHFSQPCCVPASIPRPLPGELSQYISPWEKEFIQSLLVDGDAWEHDDLVTVMNIAQRLDIESLRDLLAAWCAIQVQALSKGLSTMDAAEKIREFFSIPNEWSNEESALLQREMDYYDALNQ